MSYSRADSEFALRLARDLKAAGAMVWLDQLDIRPGDPWDRSIEAALDAARFMLVILSPASSNSENVRNEIAFALEEGKIVIPVLHKECFVPLQLRRAQRIDFSADYTRGLTDLLAFLGVAQPNEAVLDQAAEDEAKRHAAWQAREAEAHRLRGVESERMREAEAERHRQEGQRAAEQGAAERSARGEAGHLAKAGAARRQAELDERPTGAQQPRGTETAQPNLDAGSTQVSAKLRVPTSRRNLAIAAAVLVALSAGLFLWLRPNWSVAPSRPLRTLTGHSAAVASVAFSPDGRTLASGSADKTVKLWDVASGALIRTLSGHTDYVESVAFSPNGRTLASGSVDKTIKLWDVASGALIQTLSGHANTVWFVTFSPDGRTLASGSDDKTIKLWDVSDLAK
jgi:hypothetical protein